MSDPVASSGGRYAAETQIAYVRTVMMNAQAHYGDDERRRDFA